MSLRDPYTISFSHDLANLSAQEKINAILDLKDYIESHPDIWTGYDDDDFSVAEAIVPFLNGSVNLNESCLYEIIDGEFTSEECGEIALLGFSLKLVSTLVRAI